MLSSSTARINLPTQLLMLGFDLERSSQSTVDTINLRHAAPMYDIYQHPGLRFDVHKRYEKRCDIYSFGLVLLEISLGQSIYYFKDKNQDAQAIRG
jgi:hypothetical protein